MARNGKFANNSKNCTKKREMMSIHYILNDRSLILGSIVLPPCIALDGFIGPPIILTVRQIGDTLLRTTPSIEVPLAFGIHRVPILVDSER